MSFQKVIVAGYLAKDPDVKMFDGGGQVTKFSIAVNEKWQGGEHTEWFNVDCYGKTAENCATYLAKGSCVLVEGTLRTREHEGKKYTSLNAFNVRFLGSGKPKDEADRPLIPAKQIDDLSDIPF